MVETRVRWYTGNRMPSFLSRQIVLRRAVEIDIEAPLARALAGCRGKPVGLSAQLGRKLLKQLFFLVHQRLGVPAPAWIVLEDGRRFRVNAANTAYFAHCRTAVESGCYEPEVTAILDLLGPALAD